MNTRQCLSRLFFSSTRIALFVLLSLLSSAVVQRACCAGFRAGRIVWWGHGAGLQPYNRTQTNGVLERDNEMVSDIVAISAKRGTGLAVRKDGTVFTFGIGWFGANNVPAGLSNVISVAMEGNSYWAIRGDGTVARWGEERDNANIVRALSNVVSIARAGASGYLALQRDGTVLAFRIDVPGSLIRPLKVRGQALNDVVAVASMWNNLFVVKNNGAVLSLGRGSQMPYECASAESVRVDGKALTDVVALATGDGQALALKRDGTVVAWGSNIYGEANVPSGLTNVTAIAADEHLSMALKRDGTVVAWGGNYFGQTPAPPGLSNVVAIAAGWQFGLALTTGSVPSSVFIIPHGQLEIMERDADLIFKGQVVSTQVRSNATFPNPNWDRPYPTKFKLISALKGRVNGDTVIFWHYSSGPMAWSGPPPPSWHDFEVGQSYLVFAAKLDKPDPFYTVPPDAARRTSEFRQLQHDGVTRTLDARPLAGLDFKEAHWHELSLLLHDPNPSNQFYAIDELDRRSLAGRGDDEWGRSDDFERTNVSTALLPLITNTNDAVAIRALDCFATKSNVRARIEPFARDLIATANGRSSPRRRLGAIGGLSGLHFEAISNSLTQLLQNPDEHVRAGAVGLLELFPGDFAGRALRERAGDASPEVRAAAANVIGDGKIETLLPTLVKLLAEPLGLRPVRAPAGFDDPDAGGESNVRGDVHFSAGHALLKFDLSQVGPILKTNLGDHRFRLQFLCKLAQNDPAPWIGAMVEMMEARRVARVQEAQRSGLPPETFLSLSGTYFETWRIIFNWLHDLPASEFAGGKQDRCLDALENAGTTGSQEPEELYGLYRAKGLNERAAKYRNHCEKTFSYDIGMYFKRADAQFTNSPGQK